LLALFGETTTSPSWSTYIVIGVGTMDLIIKSKYPQETKIPYVPLEKDIDQLIAGFKNSKYAPPFCNC
jgi:hypothetical protein